MLDTDINHHNIHRDTKQNKDKRQDETANYAN